MFQDCSAVRVPQLTKFNRAQELQRFYCLMLDPVIRTGK